MTSRRSGGGSRSARARRATGVLGGPPVSRRALLLLGGALASGAALVGLREDGPSPAVQPVAVPMDVARWRAVRGAAYLVAHRGSGDVLPEHSLPAYRDALDRGATALEISVQQTSDGVLICLHDATYDRTTNLTGRVDEQPSSVLDGAVVLQPQLGPAWTRAPLLPAVPRLEQALRLASGRAVLCLEAKDDTAFEPMMALVDRLGLRPAVVVKAVHTSPRIEQAQREGLPVFAYVGPTDPPEATAALARRLRPELDHLGVASTDATGGPVAEEDLRAAVALGVPVWVYPVHRRSEAARSFALGAAGVVTSSWGYVAGRTPVLGRDTWATRRIAPGEMTEHPEQPGPAPSWTGPDELSLVRGTARFLTLGQLSPVRAEDRTYELRLEVRWSAPVDPGTRVVLAFAHADDRFFRPGTASAGGYSAGVTARGVLQLERHETGRGGDTVLSQAAGPRTAPGRWLELRVVVTPTSVTVTSGAGPHLTVHDSAYRGGYLHLGTTDHAGGPVSFRRLRVD